MSDFNTRKLTEKRLLDLGVPYNSNLPFLEEMRLRSSAEIAGRVIVTYSLIGVANDADKKNLYSWLKANKIEQYLEKEDIRYLTDEELSDQDLIDISWFEECLAYFAWLMKIPCGEISLYKPTDITPVFSKIPPQVEIPYFFREIQFRNFEELFQELDFYYLLHAALRHPELWKDKDHYNRFDYGVVISHRHVLEWVLHPETLWYETALDT